MKTYTKTTQKEIDKVTFMLKDEKREGNMQLRQIERTVLKAYLESIK